MKRSSILLLIAAIVTTLAGFAPSNAADCGQGGSPANSAGSCETSANQVKCGGTATPGGNVSASSEGAEVCNDGSSAAPVQGRVGASHECDCVYADGDADNQTPLNGWVRADQNGVNCDNGETSYNSGPGGSCGM